MRNQTRGELCVAAACQLHVRSCDEGHSRKEAAGMGILAADAASDILRSAIVPSHPEPMDFMRNLKDFVPRDRRKEEETDLSAVGGKRG